MENQKIQIPAKGLYLFYFQGFDQADKTVTINEKIEIFRKYYCYLKNIMVQYYKSIKKTKNPERSRR